MKIHFRILLFRASLKNDIYNGLFFILTICFV